LILARELDPRSDQGCPRLINYRSTDHSGRLLLAGGICSFWRALLGLGQCGKGAQEKSEADAGQARGHLKRGAGASG
jgi:hypothetical protein